MATKLAFYVKTSITVLPALLIFPLKGISQLYFDVLLDHEGLPGTSQDVVQKTH